MQSATLKRWLSANGCRFEIHEAHKGKRLGIASVTVRRGRRTAILPLVGSKKRLELRVVKQIVEALGLNVAKLPGPQGRIRRRQTTRA